MKNFKIMMIVAACCFGLHDVMASGNKAPVAAVVGPINPTPTYRSTSPQAAVEGPKTQIQLTNAQRRASNNVPLPEFYKTGSQKAPKQKLLELQELQAIETLNEPTSKVTPAPTDLSLANEANQPALSNPKKTISQVDTLQNQPEAIGFIQPKTKSQIIANMTQEQLQIIENNTDSLENQLISAQKNQNLLTKAGRLKDREQIAAYNIRITLLQEKINAKKPIENLLIQDNVSNEIIQPIVDKTVLIDSKTTNSELKSFYESLKSKDSLKSRNPQLAQAIDNAEVKAKLETEKQIKKEKIDNKINKILSQNDSETSKELLKKLNLIKSLDTYNMHTDSIKNLEQRLAQSTVNDLLLSNSSLSLHDQLLQAKKANSQPKDMYMKNAFNEKITELQTQLATKGEQSINAAFANIYNSIGMRRNHKLVDTLPILWTTISTSVSNLFAGQKVPKKIKDELLVIEQEIEIATPKQMNNRNFIQKLQQQVADLYQRAVEAIFGKKLTQEEIDQQAANYFDENGRL